MLPNYAEYGKIKKYTFKVSDYSLYSHVHVDIDIWVYNWTSSLSIILNARCSPLRDQTSISVRLPTENMSLYYG